MRDWKIPHIVLSLAVVLQVSLSQVALPNLVLCFGENGHFAFEFREGQEACEHNSLVNLPLLGMNTIHKRTHDMGCYDINLHIHPSYAHNVVMKKNAMTPDTGFVMVFSTNMAEYSGKVRGTYLKKNPQQYPQMLLQNTILII